ncbi:MAG: NAD(P)H-dependent oxidoreductase [Alcanivorax sp.]|nr:NAD(P)H-dependent oxidoreductase [Alcanivorax sp.]
MTTQQYRADARKILVLVSGNRHDKRIMDFARAALRGAISVGCYANVRFIDQIIPDPIARCSSCRHDLDRIGDRRCHVRDGLDHFMRGELQQADGLILCSRLHWHGFSAHMEAFLERTRCSQAPDQTLRRALGYRRRIPIGMTLLMEDQRAACLRHVESRALECAQNIGGYMTSVITANCTGGMHGVERDYSAVRMATEHLARGLLFASPRDFSMQCVPCPPVKEEQRIAVGAWGSLPDIH